jgi:hypothetical protein
MQTSNISRESISLLDRAINWLCMSERDSRLRRRLFVIAAALYFIFIGVVETGPINEYGHDVFPLLDGSWRLFCGQIPYRDFYLAIGPLEDMIVAGGMLLAHGSTQGIAIGNAVFGIVVGVWGWHLSRWRMPAIPALLVTAWLILTATLPSPLGSGPESLSCAMIYNRHGYALLGIVLVECAFASELSRFWGGISSGIALALLAFLKLNFVGVAVLLLLVTVSFRRQDTPRIWGFLFGMFCTVMAFLFYLRFAIHEFLSDMLYAIHVRGSSLSTDGAVVSIAGSTEIMTLAIMTVVAAMLITRDGLNQNLGKKIFVVGGVVIATGPLLFLTNMGENNCRLASLWMIVLLGMLTAVYPHCKEKAAISVLIALSTGSIFAGLFMDAESVRTLFLYQLPPLQSQGYSITGAGMERLKFYEIYRDSAIFRFDNGHFVVDCVNDGITLLKKSSTQNESVTTFGFDNPFEYFLQRKPAQGGSPWLVQRDNFSMSHMPEPSRLFGKYDLVMVGNYPTTNYISDNAISEAYHSYLIQHFDFVASSKWWSLYRRKR